MGIDVVTLALAKGYTDEKIRDAASGDGIAVTGAKVGQTVIISAVDENGVPTAWLPTDFPSVGGGGGIEWKTIVDFTTTESVTEIVVDKDIEGKPFELSFAKIGFYLPKNPDNTGKDTIVWVLVDSSQLSSYRSVGTSNGTQTNDRYIVGDVAACGEKAKLINGFYGNIIGTGGKDAYFSYLLLKCNTGGNSFPAGSRVIIAGIPATGGESA